jgi:hypothetical protein
MSCLRGSQAKPRAVSEDLVGRPDADEVGGDLLVDPVQEAAELDTAMPAMGLADDLASSHVESSE